jgi:hypothetical protein
MRRTPAAFAAALVLAAGCLPAKPPPAGGGAAPKLAEEELVRDHVLDNADDPASVEFDRWGPHDLKGHPKRVRARLRENNRAGAKELHDRIYWVDGNKIGIFFGGIKVRDFDDNRRGDNWRDGEDQMRELLDAAMKAKAKR